MTRVTSIVARKRKYVVDEVSEEPLTSSAASGSRAVDPAKRASSRRRIEDVKEAVLERTYRKKNESQVRAKRPKGVLSCFSSFLHDF